MKHLILFFTCLFLLSCSSDKDEDDLSNPLIGLWKGAYSENTDMYLEFSKKNKLKFYDYNHKNNTEYLNFENKTYTLDKNRIYFDQGVSWRYSLENDCLSIIFNSGFEDGAELVKFYKEK